MTTTENTIFGDLVLLVEWLATFITSDNTDSEKASLSKTQLPQKHLQTLNHGGPVLLDLPLDSTPLIGLPTQFAIDGVKMTFGPFMLARQAAHTYCHTAGIAPRFPRVYSKLDKARSAEIARLYEAMEPTPDAPETRAAYQALADETMAQWQVIKATGLAVEYAPAGTEPYPNPRKAILDLIDNNHLFVTPTRSAYGDAEFAHDAGNPLLGLTDELVSGERALVNDIFRVVHDYFGHAREGLGFRAEGEENAWRGHAAMYGPLARRALTTELRGQNSWINFGPYAEHNRKAKMGDTRFAPQKLGLLPEWVSWAGAEDPEV